MTNATSRRSLLTGAAATLAGATAIDAAAASITPDPIFAAIERHRAAESAFIALALHEDRMLAAGIDLPLAEGDYRTADMKHVVEECADARQALAETIPTTLAGLFAVLEYAESFDGGIKDFPLMDGCEQHITFAESLAECARNLRATGAATA